MVKHKEENKNHFSVAQRGTRNILGISLSAVYLHTPKHTFSDIKFYSSIMCFSLNNINLLILTLILINTNKLKYKLIYIIVFNICRVQLTRFI